MKKIIGILVVGLLIASAVLPATGSINVQLKEETKVLTPKMSSEGMSAELCFSPQSYDFGPVLEGMRLRVHFEIWNCGRLPSSLEWHLGIIDPEISPSPMNGQSSGEHDIVTVDVSTFGLTLGEYEFGVSIFSNAGNGQFNVIFELVDNLPPNTPTITGSTSGKAGTEYEYTIGATDPGGDEISYYIDWGDSTYTGWTRTLPSGELLNSSHIWEQRENYIIRAKAKDENGAESDWATLEVTMPKNKAYINPFLRFLENYPHLFPLLRQLLELK